MTAAQGDTLLIPGAHTIELRDMSAV